LIIFKDIMLEPLHTDVDRELYSLVKHMVGRLVQNMGRWPLLPLEMCFPKSRLDWMRIQRGEDTKRAKEEEAEQRQLEKEERKRQREEAKLAALGMDAEEMTRVAALTRDKLGILG
jgi:hypothetical protein